MQMGELNMPISLESRVLNWNIPTRTSLLKSTRDYFVEIASTDNRHFYAAYRRSDQNFSNRPDESSFEFVPYGALTVAIDFEASDTVEASFIVIEYSPEAHKSFSYTSPHFTHRVNGNVEHVTLAVRLKGEGTVRLGGVTTEIHRPIRDWARTVEVQSGASAAITVNTYALTEVPPHAGLVVVNFRNADGDTVLPQMGVAINPRVGAYAYLNDGSYEEPGETTLSVGVPQGADTATFALLTWKSDRTYLLGEPRVEVEAEISDDGEESIADFISGIPAGDILIVLYTTAPQLGHPTLALRPNRLAKEYVGLGCWVVFFPFSRVPSGQEVQGERVRQYSREQIGEFLTAASTRKGSNNVFICSSFPDIVAVGAVDLLKLHRWSTVYEVRDDMEEFNRVGYSKWFHPQLEARVAAEVGTVVTVSPRLARKMDVLCNQSGRAHVVPNAVEKGFVDQSAENRSVASYKARSSSQIVGYIGHLTPSWFDWRLVIDAAERLPDVTFEIIGHGKPDDLVLPGNIVDLGPRTHTEFRDIARRWKVGIIPFKPSTLTFAVDPNKVYEYLAVGLRTVTARMGSVELCPSTLVYDRSEDFAATLSAALLDPFSVEETARIEEFLKDSTWGKRAAVMLEIIGVKND